MASRRSSPALPAQGTASARASSSGRLPERSAPEWLGGAEREALVPAEHLAKSAVSPVCAPQAAWTRSPSSNHTEPVRAGAWTSSTPVLPARAYSASTSDSSVVAMVPAPAPGTQRPTSERTAPDRPGRGGGRPGEAAHGTKGRGSARRERVPNDHAILRPGLCRTSESVGGSDEHRRVARTRSSRWRPRDRSCHVQ